MILTKSSLPSPARFQRSMKQRCALTLRRFLIPAFNSRPQRICRATETGLTMIVSPSACLPPKHEAHERRMLAERHSPLFRNTSAYHPHWPALLGTPLAILAPLTRSPWYAEIGRSPHSAPTSQGDTKIGRKVVLLSRQLALPWPIYCCSI
jgi:hypothetical protein